MLEKMTRSVIILLFGMSISFVSSNLLASPRRVRRSTAKQDGPSMIELWANKVIRVSSQLNTTGFGAGKVLGPPDVFPEYGHRQGAWTPAADSRDNAQYIEVEFTEAIFLRKVDIYETNDAGGIGNLFARRTDNNKWEPLYHNDAVTLIDNSRIFSPRINITLSLVDALRIDVDCTANGTSNAVGIDAVKIHGIREMVQLWATNVHNVSSEYYSQESFGADQILCQPDVYPRYGDIAGSWTQAREKLNDAQFIAVKFSEALFLRVVDIYETWHAGAIRKLSARTPDNQWHTLYQNDTVSVIRYSRAFSPRIDIPACPVDAIQIDVDCTAANYFVEIDAIIIYGLTDCSHGKWGPCCDKNCGTCLHNNQCNTTSGYCPMDVNGTRCTSGYRGDKCDLECDGGRFGANCSRTCGHCANGDCAKGSGDCPTIASTPTCLPGFHGVPCTDECDAGEFGADCTQTCGNCANGTDTCAKDSGHCPNIASSPRCVRGFEGNLCRDQSPDPVPAAAIGGAAASVLATVVIVFILKKRRKSNKDSNEPSTEFSAVIQQEHAGVPEGSRQRGSNNEYYNVVTFHQGPSAIPVDEFEAHVRVKRASGGISSEYENLPKGLQANIEVAKKPENKGKNRYQDIVAYDHSRVVLDPLDDDPNSDYINACYIHGYKENKYVASQGPTDKIINDFWRTIWQVDTGKVVMLTNLVEDTKTKSEQYWPNAISEMAEFGQIRVRLLAEDVYADFTVRILHVTNKKSPEQTKEITQFHFTAWPDHSVPSQATGLLNFREKVNAKRAILSGPMFVHCSAGIGRTGTFIGLDYLINQADEEGVVDVLACVRLMRQQRINMIQTEGQYAFLYDALIEAIKLSNCSVPNTVFPSVYLGICLPDADTGQSKLEQQFQVLKDLSPALKTTDFKTALDPENKHKNRNTNILAAESARPFLYTPVPGANNYINAVFIQAYKRKRAFIITQSPLAGTVIDFWRLIHEQNVRTIIMLNTVDKAAKDSGIYWPEVSGQYGPFDVETLDVENGDFFETRLLQLKYKKEIPKTQAHIKQFQCTFWPDDEIVPRSSVPLITLIEDVERWQQKSEKGPIVVHCLDGASKSGLYCTLSTIIERLKVDQEVNILQTIKQIRTNRPEIIRNLDQFRFIHEAVLAYLESFQTYANF